MAEFGTSLLTVDPITRTLAGIDYVHKEIHGGNHYNATYSVSSVGAIVTPADTMTLTFKTPEGPEKLHMSYGAKGSSGMRTKFMEAPTGGGLAPVGTVEVFNNNRSSENISSIKTRDNSTYATKTIDGVNYVSKIEGANGNFINVQITDAGTLAAASKEIDGVTYTADTTGSDGNYIQVAIVAGDALTAASATVDGVVYTADTAGAAGNNIQVEITDAGDGGATSATETGAGTEANPYLVVVDIDILTGTKADVSDAIDGIVGGHITGDGGDATAVSVTPSTSLTGGIDSEVLSVKVDGDGNAFGPYVYICTCDVTVASQQNVRDAINTAGAGIVTGTGGSATAGTATAVEATALEGGQEAGILDLSVTGLGTTGSHYLIVADVDVGVITRQELVDAILADTAISALVFPWNGSADLVTVTASTALAGGVTATVASVAGKVSTQCTLFTGGNTLFDAYIEGSSSGISGSGDFSSYNETILAPDTLYQLSLYGTATEAGTLELSFYQHTDKA